MLMSPSSAHSKHRQGDGQGAWAAADLGAQASHWAMERVSSALGAAPEDTMHIHPL